MTRIDHSGTPSAEYRFFIYDALDGEFSYYRSAEDRDAAKRGVIESYLDDGWNDEVEQVLAGEITHTCQKIDVQERPPENEIGEDGHDLDGMYWEPEWSYRCDYDLLPLTPEA